MYFYKTANLVREGMVIVHSSGLNGDPTSAKVGCLFSLLVVCSSVNEFAMDVR